jgi:AcrR family transcriptional regulator
MSVPESKKGRTYLRAEDRRAQILDVAKHVFARRGFHVANVADICAEAKIGRGTLYQYFDNKRDVLLALMEDIAQRIKRVLDHRKTLDPSLIDAQRLPVRVIVAYCEKSLRELLDAVFVDEASLRLILREARGLDGAVDEVLAIIDGVMLGALETDLRAAQSAGVMRKGDCRMMARYLLGGVEKIVLHALVQTEPVDREAIVRATVEMELFGLLDSSYPRAK